MDRRQIGLKLIMDELDLGVRVDSFEDRLILQKAMYLAKAAGVDLGYHYRWYLRGPYSPPVADDGFATAADLAAGDDFANQWVLDETSKDRLASVADLLRSGADVSDRTGLARRLELLASVHFLIDQKQVRGREPRTIGGRLRKFGKSFTDEDVARALGELKAHGMLS